MDSKLKRPQKELEAEVIGGNPAPYAELFFYYYRQKIFHFFSLLGETEEVAEELTHRTYLRAKRKLEEGKFKPGSLFLWTKKIAYRIWLSYMEKEKPLLINSFSDFGNSYMEAIPNHHFPDHYDEMRVRYWRVLGLAEKNLSAHQFIAFRMRIDGYSNQQIAAAIGKSKAVVEVYLSQAFKKMREVCKREKVRF